MASLRKSVRTILAVLFAVPASADTFDASTRGWFSQAGQHSASNLSSYAGQGASTDRYRAFFVFDLGTLTRPVASGVLRAMGRPGPAAVFNLVGYWGLALPLGGWLALGTDAGLAGLWWGLCAGLVIVATGLVLWIWRGGASLVRRV